MSLAKAVVTGVVYRTPEKRYTQNNIAIYSVIINIGEQEETLIRVISKRKSLESLLDTVRQGDKVLVEGRLQVATSKYNDGTDKKYFEIDAAGVEVIQSGKSTPVEPPEVVIEQPATADVDDEDEIPF